MLRNGLAMQLFIISRVGSRCDAKIINEQDGEDSENTHSDSDKTLKAGEITGYQWKIDGNISIYEESCTYTIPKNIEIPRWLFFYWIPENTTGQRRVDILSPLEIHKVNLALAGSLLKIYG